MARKTFISYKYSEAKNLRDDILEALGGNASYYQGETSDSPDMSDKSTEYIKEKLKDMIYSTSVTIVLISPNMTDSAWIDWGIEYSLKQIKREDKTSGTNGVVGVVMKYNDDYTWLRPSKTNPDGHKSTSTDNQYLYNIITNNRFNKTPQEYICEECKTVDFLNGSYISLVNEEKFFEDPNYYIENAFEKSKHTNHFDLCRKK
ncbi:TIR domain-containing protein [Carnobacterium maltaromaticum]|uniref:TIR domain-containing protein n=1 Tax=Carnobacterium maltaromaticum TaxID=2751 RepID=A0AAW9K613_CARML|nr:TIR domain-containing protein [Carnobacterium maltaromaticum]MDZ5757783.1 TIR domain-containing protein [Carnobacterium maltaromaticum]